MADVYQHWLTYAKRLFIVYTKFVDEIWVKNLDILLPLQVHVTPELLEQLIRPTGLNGSNHARSQK
jgi:hypothetical protein